MRKEKKKVYIHPGDGGMEVSSSNYVDMELEDLDETEGNSNESEFGDDWYDDKNADTPAKKEEDIKKDGDKDVKRDVKRDMEEGESEQKDSGKTVKSVGAWY